MASGTRKSNNKTDSAGTIVDGSTDTANGSEFRLGEPVTIDPAAALDSPGDGGSGASSAGSGNAPDLTPTGRVRRKYGRRSSASNSTEEALRIDVVTSLLFSSHVMLAAITKTPEFAIETVEAEQIAKAYAELAVFYPILKQSEKTIAWVNMFSALGMVYGTRAVAIYKRKKMEAETEVVPGVYPSNLRSVQ